MEIDEINNQVQKVRRTKAAVTVAILVMMVILTIIFWDASNTYVIELDGDREAGYEWTYTLSDNDVIKEISNSYENGIFRFEFQGMESGKTEISFFCIKDGDKGSITDEIKYGVRVDKALNIVNKIILAK